jgi:hypothetical protein
MNVYEESIWCSGIVRGMQRLWERTVFAGGGYHGIA